MKPLNADQLISCIRDPVLVIDEETRLRYANPAAERLFGWTAEEQIGTEMLSLVHPDDLELMTFEARHRAENDIGTPIEVRLMTATGWRLIEAVGAGYHEPGLPQGRVVSLRDLTERRQWEVASDDLALFRALLQNAASITMQVDADGTVKAASAGVTRALGHSPAEIQGQPLANLVVAADRPRFDTALRDAVSHRGTGSDRRFNIDVALDCRGEGSIPFHLTIVNLLDDPVVGGLVVSGHDISELHAARLLLAHAAEHDDLTGLPNRGHLTRQLALRLRDEGPRSTAVAFIDLDRFKIMNDLFGHDVGDEILVTVAKRLRNTIRSGDIVARLGGDEFVVVASAKSDAEIDQLMRRIEHAVSEPMRLRAGPLQIYASIGLAVGHPGDVVQDVLTEADSAMYDVKIGNRGPMGTRTRPLAERRSLAEDLEPAFRYGQFEVHYQPIVALADGATVALEALVRWHHPRRGLLLPEDFIDVVEDTGRDRELDDLVTSTVTSDMSDFLELGPPGLRVGMNISMAQLAEPGYADRVDGLVRRSGVAPESVVIEISERCLLDSDTGGSPVRAALQSLSDAGFTIAVDDFGTGHSSLQHLVSFPIDVLKIDSSFVAEIDDKRSRQSIVAALISLARAAGMEVVAEGVEHSAQIDVLQQLGCNHGQGFYFSRPLSTSELLTEFQANGALHVDAGRQAAS